MSARLYDGAGKPYEDRPLYVANTEADIAAIRLFPNVEKGEKIFYPFHESFLHWHDHAVLQVGVGDPCFVVGYPEGMLTETTEGPLPIWKAATIASEPNVR